MKLMVQAVVLWPLFWPRANAWDTSTLLSFYSGNLILINVFDTKFWWHIVDTEPPSEEQLTQRGPNMGFCNLIFCFTPPNWVFPPGFHMVQVSQLCCHISTSWSPTWLRSLEILLKTNTKAWLNQSKVVPSRVFSLICDWLTIPQ